MRHSIIVPTLVFVSVCIRCFSADASVVLQKARLVPLDGSSVELVQPNAVKLAGDIGLVTSGQLAELPRFNPLDAAEILIRLPEPRPMDRLTIPRVGYEDWAIPSRVRLYVNGDDMGSFDLKAERVKPMGKMQAVDVIHFGREIPVRDIRVVVEAVDAESGNRHGVMKVLAAKPAPLEIDLEEYGSMPLDSVGIEMEVEASSAVAMPVFGVRAYQFRRHPQTTFELPEFKQGLNRVRVLWDELEWEGCLPSPIRPPNFNAFFLRDTSDSADMSLVSWKYITDPACQMKPAWESVPTRDFGADADGWRPGIPQAGFGRFGWLQNSGLLAGALDANGFSGTVADAGGDKTSYTWNLQFGDATYCEWKRTKADWVSVRHLAFYEYSSEVKDELAAKAPELIKQKRVPHVLTGSIMAPGFMADSEDGKVEITLRNDPGTSNDRSSGWIVYPSEEGVKSVPLNGSIPGKGLSEGWFVIAWPNAMKSPVLFVPKVKPQVIKLEGSSLTLDFGKPLKRIGIAFPAGFRAWEGGSLPSLGEAERIAERARELASILRAYPVGNSQRFREVDDGGMVEVEETVRHLVWENEWGEGGRKVSPISPLLSFAADQQYRIGLPSGLEDSGWPTKYGPYQYVDGNRMRYRLAIPPLEAQMYLAPQEGVDKRRAELGSEIASLVTTTREKPRFRDTLQAWWMWAPGSLAFPLLSESEKTAYLDAWRDRLDKGLSENVWFLRREPFSGSSYPVAFGWIEDSTQTLGDVNSGVGAALYALWAYARCSGDWDFVRSKWPVVRAVIEYFLLEHDWCLMETGAREHSASSAIDMDGIAYEGVVAYASMADSLGMDDEAAFGRFLAARLAVPTCVRWLGMHWLHPNEDRNEWDGIGVGFGEFPGVDIHSVTHGTPDQIVSELALSLSWVGQYPELYELHRWGLGDGFWKWFEWDFVEKRIPDWRKNHKGNRNNHPANVAAHLYMRALLGEKTEALVEELEQQGKWGMQPARSVAQENAGFYALLSGRDFPIVLRSWGRAGVLKAEYDAVARKALLAFHGGDSFRLVAEVQEPVKRVLINEARVDFEQSQGRFSCTVPQGESEIILQF